MVNALKRINHERDECQKDNIPCFAGYEMNERAIVLKSVKRFSDKNCGKNKELEHSPEPSEGKNALEYGQGI